MGMSSEVRLAARIPATRSNFQRIALQILRQRSQDFAAHGDEGRSLRLAHRGLLARHVHHGRTTCGVVMRQLLSFLCHDVRIE